MELKNPLSYFPLVGDLKTYQMKWLPRDLIAGLSVAAVQVPTAIAYAQLAGFSPEIGLYSSILPVIVYGFLGSSRQLVVGPDAATCTMVASLVAPLAGGNPALYVGLSSGLSLAAGLLMIIGGFTGMGFIVNFFARPILVGFLNGIAASIIVGQLGKLLGISLEHRDFIPSLIELVSRFSQTHWVTFLVGASTLALLALLKKVAPKSPTSLIALVLASWGLLQFGGSENGVKLVGSVPSGLPALGLPHVSYHAGQGILVSAFGLVIVSFTSGMLTARSIAARSGQSINANQEMWALGVANIASGLSGGFAITGADSRTAVNAASGNKTQLSSVVAALATAAVAACLSGPLAFLPLSALAAVLIFSALHLLDFSSYKELRRVDEIEFRLSLATTLGVLSLGVLPGVAVAIALALAVIMLRINKPDDTILGKVPGLEGYNDISLSADATTIPGVLIWRFEGPLVFFNSDYFKARVLQLVSQVKPAARFLILSLEAISQTDATGIKAVEDLYIELEKQGVKMLVARPKTFMRKIREKTGLGTRLGTESVFPTISAAVAAVSGSNGEQGQVDTNHSYSQFYELQNNKTETSDKDSQASPDG